MLFFIRDGGFRWFQHSTYHLEGGNVFLPPNVFLVLRAHRGHHVVEVHDHMHECIQQCEECAVTTYDNKFIQLIRWIFGYKSGEGSKMTTDKCITEPTLSVKIKKPRVCRERASS